jgi:hypothetical protein
VKAVGKSEGNSEDGDHKCICYKGGRGEEGVVPVLFPLVVEKDGSVKTFRSDPTAMFVVPFTATVYSFSFLFIKLSPITGKEMMRLNFCRILQISCWRRILSLV